MKRYVPCPDGGRCGHRQHQVGSAQLFECGRSRRRSTDGAAMGAIMTPSGIGSPVKDAYIMAGVHVDMHVEGNAHLKGEDTYVSNLHAKSYVAAYCAVAHNVSSDAYIMVSERSGGEITIEKPGQILLIRRRQPHESSPEMPLSVSYPKDTTHVHEWSGPGGEFEAKDWARRQHDWRALSLLPKGDPLRVDMRNKPLLDWIESVGGVDPETGNVDRDLLAAGLLMFENP